MKVFGTSAGIITAPEYSATYYYWPGIADLPLFNNGAEQLFIGTLSDDGESIAPIGYLGRGRITAWTDEWTGWMSLLGDISNWGVPVYQKFAFSLGIPGDTFTGPFHFGITLHTVGHQMWAGIESDLWLMADGMKPINVTTNPVPLKQYQIGKLP